MVFGNTGAAATAEFANASDANLGGENLADSIAENESSILALGRINITARYLNISGIIQSGTDTVKLRIDESFDDPGFAPDVLTSFF